MVLNKVVFWSVNSNVFSRASVTRATQVNNDSDRLVGIASTIIIYVYFGGKHLD